VRKKTQICTTDSKESVIVSTLLQALHALHLRLLWCRWVVLVLLVGVHWNRDLLLLSTTTTGCGVMRVVSHLAALLLLHERGKLHVVVLRLLRHTKEFEIKTIGARADVNKLDMLHRSYWNCPGAFKPQLVAAVHHRIQGN